MENHEITEDEGKLSFFYLFASLFKLAWMIIWKAFDLRIDEDRFPLRAIRRKTITTKSTREKFGNIDLLPNLFIDKQKISI